MRRKIICLLAALLMLAAMALPVLAREPGLNHVTDGAGLLTDAQIQSLETRAAAAGEYGAQVYIVTVPDYRQINMAGAYEAASDLYWEYNLGQGDDCSGIILLISMAERDYALFRTGDRAEYAFGDYALEKLEDSFLDELGRDDWYGGFSGYVEACTRYLQQAAAGKPVRESPAALILIFCAIAALIAAGVVAGLYAMMKSVGKMGTANAYIADGLKLTGCNDVFTHRTHTRRKIEHSTSSGSSGGHVKTGGGGGGRSGKF